MPELSYPIWVGLTHVANILFLTLLMRSGFEILGGHPMLYWNDACRPGSEWLRFTRKKMPTDTLWTAEDEKEPYSPWLALPGRDHLGIGRYWHFTAVIGWILTGVLYLLLMIFSGRIQQLIPHSWDIFPQAFDTLVTYLSLRMPPETGHYNPLQQLTYLGVLFILAPLQILTGIAMSPAVSGRFPWYTRLLGGRQAARSLHFVGLILFAAFIIHHVAIVIAHGFGHEMSKIVLGITNPTTTDQTTATWVGLTGLAIIAAIHVWATRASLKSPRKIQHLLMPIVDPARNLFLSRLRSRQDYTRSQISPAPRVNGRPPKNEAYQDLLTKDFKDWRFEVTGLVETPLSFTLEQLRELPAANQITRHCCIQGWSYIAEWQGVAVATLLDLCKPTEQARYILFETFDEKWEDEGQQVGNFYSVLDLHQGRFPQTILAYSINQQPLPEDFGAPLRLRVESQLGYKMAKFVCRMRLIDDYKNIGQGHGNWRADTLYYSFNAPI